MTQGNLWTLTCDVTADDLTGLLQVSLISSWREVHTRSSVKTITLSTRMWANAQRDGRPAEYRWRPLFNATQSGWRPLLECRAVTLPRRETRSDLQRCPKLTKRSQPLVGRSSPYCGGHVEEILLLNKFFSDCRYMPQLQRYSPTKMCDGAEMAIFCVIFASCIFSEPRAAHFRPAF